VDGNGSVIDQAFDAASRLLTRTVTAGSGVSLLATKETFGYDNVGRMTSMRTDWGSNRDLLMVDEVFVPDSLGRNGSETFRYYGAGGVTTDPVVIASSFAISGGGEDPTFRRSLTYSSGHVVGTSPDAVSRLKSMTLSVPGGSQGASLASYRWGGGQVLRRSLNYVGTSNSQVTEFSFDAYRRLSTLKDTLNGGPSPYSQFDFEWDAAGNLLKEKYTKVNGQVGDRFSYDPFDRVTGAKLGVKTQADMDGAYGSAQSIKEIAYALDPGNSRDLVTETPDGGTPTTTDYTTEGGSPRYQQVGGVFPLYDGEGNCVFDGTYYLAYDFKNRLSEVYIAVEGEMGAGSQALVEATSARRPIRTRVSADALRSSRAAIQKKLAGDLGRALRNGKAHRDAGDLQAPLSGGSSSSMTLVLVGLYGYDPMNRRVLRSVPGVHDQRFSYDGWREVEELKPAASGSGISAQKAFVWGVRIDELLTYQRKETDNSWTGFYATQGRHDSVVALRQADAGETLIERVEYDPYGKASVFVGSSTTPQATSLVGNPYLYAGRRMDEETGYLYLRNRYLHTGWGRFLTNDPIGNWGDGANLGNGLGYVGNSPPSASDPSGLYSVSDAFGGDGVIHAGDGGAASDGWICGTAKAEEASGAKTSGTNGCQDPAGKDPEKPSGPMTLGPSSIAPTAGPSTYSVTLSSGDTISVNINNPVPPGSTITIDVDGSGNVSATLSSPEDSAEMWDAAIEASLAAASLHPAGMVAGLGYELSQGNLLGAGLALVPLDKLARLGIGLGRLAWGGLKRLFGCAVRTSKHCGKLDRAARGGAKFPGTNPAKAPKGFEWRGKPGSTPGSKEGNWYNPKTGESLRPDLNHPGPIGPHWDYRDPSGNWFRIFPDGSQVPK
jgi:RHS repeat-associated protein